MKNLKFSRLFAALMFVAVLGLTGCKPEADKAEPKAIEGTWVNDAEKYEITSSTYKNYYAVAGEYYLYYSTKDIVITEIDETSGILYGKFDDATHIGFGAEVGQWYALYYFDLTDTSVKLLQAFKAGGKAGCDTLEEAKAEYTIDNGYFPTGAASVCTKK